MASEMVVEVPEAKLKRLLRGNNGSIRVPVSDNAPGSTPIDETVMGETYTLTGVICEVDDINNFDRDDGSQGQVRNVKIQDRTGDIRVSIWGDEAEHEYSVGDYLHLFNVSVESGYQDMKEAKVGYDSSLRTIPAEKNDERFVTLTLD